MCEFLSLRDGGRAEPEVDHSRTLPDKDLTPARSVYPQGDDSNIVANSTSYQTLSTADAADWISSFGEARVFLCGPPSDSLIPIHAQRGHKGLLRDLDFAELAHALFAGFLLVEQFPFPGRVAAIAFRGHIFA